MEEERFAFSSWKYKDYFDFISVNDGNIKVRCTLCPGEKVLSTFKNTTSNLKKHLDKQHATTSLKERAPPGVKEKDMVGPSPKQMRLDFEAKPTSGAELNRLVGRYVVEEMLPVNTVDSPSFRDIVRRIPTSKGTELPHRTSFASYLDREYSTMEENLRTALRDVDFVSTTADIWTANNKSYMGVTLHWFSRHTLERKKAALACKRVRGRHTYDVIGQEIEDIHSSYGIVNKVVATVTDNGSNFVKAFRVYQAPSDDDEMEEESLDEVTFVPMSDLLSAEHERDAEAQIALPPHHRCASHTINLVTTNDVDKYLTSIADVKVVYRSSTAKCSALWTKASRSSTASEAVEEVSKRKLLVPTSTRWNSFFDSVKRVTEIPMHELNTLCTKLGVKGFKDKEYQFLHEYCTVTRPLTIALDILQADCPYGTLLPTLEALMQRALALKHTLSSMTAGLPDAIVQVWSIFHLSEIYSTILLLNTEYSLWQNNNKMQIPENNNTINLWILHDVLLIQLLFL